MISSHNARLAYCMCEICTVVKLAEIGLLITERHEHQTNSQDAEYMRAQSIPTISDISPLVGLQLPKVSYANTS